MAMAPNTEATDEGNILVSTGQQEQPNSPATTSSGRQSPHQSPAAHITEKLAQHHTHATEHLRNEGIDVASAVTLVSSPVKLKQGRRVKLVQTAKEFQLSFDILLKHEPSETSNIVHFAVDGNSDSHLPSINIIGGGTQLVAQIYQGICHADILGPENGLRVGHTTHVSIQYKDGTVTFDVGGQETTKDNVHPQIPLRSPLYVWVSNPILPAAQGTLNNMVYRVRASPPQPGTVQPMSQDMDLPPSEKRLLQQTRLAIEENKRFRSFDAFFGVFLILNSLMIGLQLELETENNKTMWMAFDISFIIIFFTEFVLRIRLVGHKTCRAFFCDGWLVFDATVICLAIFDLALADLPKYLRMLRLLRLAKLAKMVRLVRAFRELGILVEGVLYSFKTLVWTFFLLVLCTYVGGILVVKTEQLRSDGDVKALRPGSASEDFQHLPRAMWRLMQLATFNNWTDAIRDFILIDPSFSSYLLAIEVLLFIGFVGLGILNMVAGILCHTAFVLSQKHKVLRGAEVLLEQRGAMAVLRQVLRTWGERPLFKSDRFIGTDELFEAISCDEKKDDKWHETGNVDELCPEGVDAKMTPAEAAKVLKLSGTEVLGLCETFGENGYVEIDGLIDAIGIKELQAYHSLMNSDWASSKIMSTMRPVDMVFFNFSIREVEKSLSSIERAVTSACAMVFDTLHCILEQSEQASTMLSLEKNSAWSPPTRAAIPQPAHVSVSTLEAAVKQSNLAEAEANIYMPLDSIFGFLICLNGIFIGIQISEGDSTHDLENELFYTADFMFTILFAVEFVCRALLLANMDTIDNDESVADASTFEMAQVKLGLYKNLKKKMRMVIFPPWPPEGFSYVLQVLFKMLKRDFSLAFDALIVFLSLSESLVLANLRRAKLTSADPSILSLLRIFRLFRVAKLLRVFKLFPQLQMLLFALIQVWKTVLWSLALMLLVIYAFSIYSRVVFQNSGLDKYFGSLTQCALTGWRLATFDNWGVIVEDVFRKRPWSIMMLIFILITLGLGLMKMIIGVMSESAINLSRKRGQEAQRDALSTYIEQMAKLHRMFSEELGTDIIPQEVLENALKIKFRPRQHDLEGHAFLTPQAMSAAMRPDFVLRLLRIFKQADFTTDAVKQVFEKVDYQRRGYISIDLFAKGGIVMKEDLTRIELFASITALRELRHKSNLLNTRLVELHNQLDTFLQHASALINRKRYVPDSATQRRQNTMMGCLSQKAQDALVELSSKVGAVPEVKNGKLKMVQGKGRVQIDGDLAIFSECGNVKDRVWPQDLILLQIKCEEKGERTVAVEVKNYVGQNKMRVSRPNYHGMLAGGSEFPYLIARTQTLQHGPLRPFEDRHELHCKGQLSPRSASMLFNWELNTKKRHDARLEDLLSEETRLLSVVESLEMDLKALHDRAACQHVFDALKAKAKKVKARVNEGIPLGA